MTEKYDEWPANGVRVYRGNMKVPPRKLIIEWILKAWNELDVNIIVKSFKSCALNVNVDGSEDTSIHCFKNVQPCESGYDKLKRQLQSLQDESTDNNPFACIYSDVEEAAVDFLLVDQDDEDKMVEIG